MTESVYIKGDFETENPRDARQMQVGQYGFHGDVKIERTNGIEQDTSNWKVLKHNCVALGEVTGHVHKIFPIGEDSEVMVLENPENTSEKVFSIKGEAEIKHQEHAPVKLGEGDYYVSIQKEYDYLEERAREVRD